MHAAAVESEVQNANNNQCWPRPKNWYNNDDEYCCCCADSRRCISKKMPNGLLQSAGCRFFQSLNECDFNNVSLCIAENATKHARTQRTHEDGYRISTISASFWTRFFFNFTAADNACRLAGCAKISVKQNHSIVVKINGGGGGGEKVTCVPNCNVNWQQFKSTTTKHKFSQPWKSCVASRCRRC